MAGEIRTESALYGPTRLFVNTYFLQKLREHIATTSLQVFVADTSLTAGNEGGQWSRPDVAALVLGRGQFVPHWVADLHTFEVKTAAGLNEAAVYEANAHGRFGRFAWLVFQAVGRASPDSDGVFKRVTKLASQMGVGVIHFDNESDPQNWNLAFWPRATGAENAVADSFVRERFPADTKKQIAARLNTLGWLGGANEH